MAIYGRESEIARILDDCVAERLVVISSVPGLGTSALLADGVAPALQARAFIPVILREWQGRGIATALKESIAAAVRSIADDTFHADVEPLDEMLMRIQDVTHRHPVLVLDQFEDYLRCHSGTDVSDSFDAELSNAIAGRCGRFVIALHDYALKPFERLAQYIPNLLGFHFVLQPLAREAARQMVLAECAGRRFDIEPAAIEALVIAPPAVCGAGISPFLVRQGVTRLLDSETRLKSGVARMSTVEGNGGADRLILESLDQKIGDMLSSHVELFFRWCNILISPEAHRLCVSEKSLTEYAGKLNRFALTLLPILEENGLLRSIEIQNAIRYEIARDSLTLILADWRQRREIDILARRRASFRIRSISVAAGCIVAIYVVWILINWKH